MSFTIYPIKSPIAFSLFNIDIRWYGIVIAFSIFLGIVLNYFFIKKNYSKNEAEMFIDFCPGLIISAIFGARFFYVIGDLKFYLNDLKEILMLNHGGLSIYGAIIFGIIYFLIYSKKHNLSFLKYADSICLFLPLLQAIGRLGNYFNQEAFGKPAIDSFFRLYVDKIYRPDNFKDFNFFEPTFLYEGFLNIVCFILLLFIFYKTKDKNKTGIIFCHYLILYSIVRIIVENIRIDSILNIYNIPIATIISILTIIVATCILIKLSKKV